MSGGFPGEEVGEPIEGSVGEGRRLQESRNQGELAEEVDLEKGPSGSWWTTRE